jgi:hypothetical protein
MSFAGTKAATTGGNLPVGFTDLVCTIAGNRTIEPGEMCPPVRSVIWDTANLTMPNAANLVACLNNTNSLGPGVVQVGTSWELYFGSNGAGASTTILASGDGTGNITFGNVTTTKGKSQRMIVRITQVVPFATYTVFLI